MNIPDRETVDQNIFRIGDFISVIGIWVNLLIGAPQFVPNHLIDIMYVGTPVPIVAITAGIAHDQYGHDEL